MSFEDDEDLVVDGSERYRIGEILRSHAQDISDAPLIEHKRVASPKQTSAKPRRHREAIPPPPHPQAVNLTAEEACGYLGIRRRALTELRRNDPTFPKGILLSGGIVRWRRAELDRWLDSRPRGFSTMGGLREGAFRRRQE